MRGPVATLHHIGDEFHMSKVEQMRAAIARHGSAVPTHLDLMCGDADDCAQTGGLVVVLADPDDAVAYRQPTSHCGIHDIPPDRWVTTPGDGTAFSAVAPSWRRVRRPSATSKRKISPALWPS